MTVPGTCKCPPDHHKSYAACVLEWKGGSTSHPSTCICPSCRELKKNQLAAAPLPHHHSITIHSFKVGSKFPPETRWSLDVSNYRDPIGQKSLRVLNGRNAAVQEFVSQDPRVKVVIEEFCALGYGIITQAREQYVSFGVYDRHGLYTAPAIVEMLAKALRDEGFTVHVDHHELED